MIETTSFAREILVHFARRRFNLYDGIMRRARNRHQASRYESVPEDTIKRPTFWQEQGFFIATFLLFLADAVMAFAAPSTVDLHTGSALWTGVIISVSSMVGLVCDVLFGKRFRGSNAYFFLRMTFVLFALFPLSLFFTGITPFNLLLGVAIWGIYYELIYFSTYLFIDKARANSHGRTSLWSRVEAQRALAYTLGPLLAAWLWVSGPQGPLWVAIGIGAGGLVIAISLIGRQFFAKNKPQPSQMESKALAYQENPVETVQKEFKIWNILGTKLWPLFLLVLCLYLTDAAFWTIGPMLTTHQQSAHPWAVALLPLRSLPSFLLVWLIPKLTGFMGKKRMSFLAAMFAALSLIALPLLPFSSAWLVLIFLSGAGMAIALPMIEAVFEDYVSRAEFVATDIVGYQRAAVSIAYIVGPISAGLMTALWSEAVALGAISALLLIVVIINFIVVPRKIRLPQAELQAEVE